MTYFRSGSPLRLCIPLVFFLRADTLSVIRTSKKVHLVACLFWLVRKSNRTPNGPPQTHSTGPACCLLILAPLPSAPTLASIYPSLRACSSWLDPTGGLISGEPTMAAPSQLRPSGELEGRCTLKTEHPQRNCTFVDPACFFPVRCSLSECQKCIRESSISDTASPSTEVEQRISVFQRE